MLVYLLAQGRHRLSRTVGALAAVALGVALFIALVAAGDGFAAAARQPLADIGADIVISRPDATGEPTAQTTRGVRQPFGIAPLTTAELSQLGELAGVADVTGGLLLWDFSANSYQTLLGVDLDANPDRPQTDDALGAVAGPAQLARSLTQGRFLAQGDTGVVVVDQHYAAFFSLRPGGTVDIGENSFEVIGVVTADGGNQTAGADFYLPLTDAQSMAGLNQDQVNQAYVRAGEATNVDSIIIGAEGRLGQLSATTEQSIVSVMGGITAVSDRFASVAALAALLGGLLLTAVTLHAAINLRTSEVGVMRAVGWRERDVVRLFTIEGIALSTTGSVVGIVLGWLTIQVFAQIPIDLPAISGVSPDLDQAAPESSFTIVATLSLRAVLIAVAVAVVVGGMVSLLSARRASRLKPADALRA